MRSRRWVRKAPDDRESVISAMAGVAVGVGAGLTTFYLGRLFLAREPLPPAPEPKRRLAGRRLPPAGGSSAE